MAVSFTVRFTERVGFEGRTTFEVSSSTFDLEGFCNPPLPPHFWWITPTHVDRVPGIRS